MSRLFEYLRTLDGGAEPAKVPEAVPSSASQNPGDARQTLSVLHPPRTGTSETPKLPEFPVSHVDVQPEDRLIWHVDPTSPAADRFKLLRIRLRELRKTRPLRTLLVTSALPRDGKSTVVMNLASALLQQGQQSVLVVDGDLHRCSLTQRFSSRDSAGVAECIKNGLDPCSAIQRLDPLGCHFLPAGASSEQASEWLHSDAVSLLVQKISFFDWIVVDSPPIVLLSDAVSLARNVDGALLVVRADSTPSNAVEDAISLIGRKRLVGIVLNGIQESDRPYRRYSDYYYATDGKKAPPIR